MEVTAYLKSARISPRKVRLVARLVKGRDAVAVRNQLPLIMKHAAQPILKLLNSALSNAHHNHSMVEENLVLKDIMVNGGPVLKRFRPKGFGSTSPLAKRTSHITIILSEKVAGLKAEHKIKTEEKTEKNVKHEETKHEVQKELGKKEGAVKKFTRRFFRRKAI